MSTALYYLGRLGQALGMWILLEDLFTDTGMGPNPRWFGVGVAVFLAGWGIVRAIKPK